LYTVSILSGGGGYSIVGPGSGPKARESSAVQSLGLFFNRKMACFVGFWGKI